MGIKVKYLMVRFIYSHFSFFSSHFTVYNQPLMLSSNDASAEKHFLPNLRKDYSSILWPGGHIFLNQRHNFLFIFRNGYAGILAETV